MLDGIKYNVDNIQNKDNLILAQVGSGRVINPVTAAIVIYCKICNIPKITEDMEINELWFRINYIRNFNFYIYEATEPGHQHIYEPRYADLVNNKGLFIEELAYVERKRWINSMIDKFILKNRELSDGSMGEQLTSGLMQQRNLSLDAYIKSQTGIKINTGDQYLRPNQPKQNSQQDPKTESEKKENAKPEQFLDAHGDPMPDIIVQHHKEIQLKIALEKAGMGHTLTQQQQQLIDEHNKATLAKRLAEENAKNGIVTQKQSSDKQESAKAVKPVKKAVKPSKNKAVTKKTVKKRK